MNRHAKAQPDDRQRADVAEPDAGYRFAPGDRPLEGYTVDHAAGRGGFGEVYQAVSDSGRIVALKAILGHEQIELRGISQCMNLKSPHLVTIFDVRYSSAALPFVIMEYVNGPSLRDLLDQSPNGLGPDKAAFLLGEIAKGLTYLHDCGIVHRDLKPANIFYEDGYVKIGDYGLSKAIGDAPHSGQTITVGTVHYMAPEIGSGNYDRSIDIYALGVILYEMLTGKVPYAGDSVGQVLMQHATSQPKVDDLPAPFGPVIQKAMHRDPRQRYATVTQLLDDLLKDQPLATRMSSFNRADLSQAAQAALAGAKRRAVAGAAGTGALGQDGKHNAQGKVQGEAKGKAQGRAGAGAAIPGAGRRATSGQAAGDPGATAGKPGAGTNGLGAAIPGAGTGVPGTGIPGAGASPKRRLPLMLLALLPVPGFWFLCGLHRFYAGKIFTGVLWLLTGGLLGVGQIVDIVLIAVGSFKDAKGQPIVNWWDHDPLWARQWHAKCEQSKRWLQSKLGCGPKAGRSCPSDAAGDPAREADVLNAAGHADADAAARGSQGRGDEQPVTEASLDQPRHWVGDDSDAADRAGAVRHEAMARQRSRPSSWSGGLRAVGSFMLGMLGSFMLLGALSFGLAAAVDLSGAIPALSSEEMWQPPLTEEATWAAILLWVVPVVGSFSFAAVATLFLMLSRRGDGPSHMLRALMGVLLMMGALLALSSAAQGWDTIALQYPEASNAEAARLFIQSYDIRRVAVAALAMIAGLVTLVWPNNDRTPGSTHAASQEA